jgi:1-acyl-sn-glycerol-3-phosphate acyltransferase
MVILSAVSSRKPFLYRLWHLQLMYGDLSKALGMKSIARHVKVADGAQPFQLGDAKMPHWEVGIRLLLLLPINLVMVSSFFLLSFLLMWINDFIRSRQLQSQPSIDKWVIRIWATAFLFAVRAPVSVRDLRPEGDVGGDVYCANHVSVLDPFAIYWHAQAAFLSLTSNRDRPIVGYFCKLAQCFFVERATHSGQGSSSDVIDWLRRTSEVGRARPPAVVFPEGVVTAGHTMIPFRTSSFRCCRPITPIALRYPPYAGAPRDSITLPGALCVLLSRVYTPVSVEVLPTHVPSDEECRDPALFAARVQESIAAQLGISICDDFDYSQSVSVKQMEGAALRKDGGVGLFT